jgi:hypothetical protein
MACFYMAPTVAAPMKLWYTPLTRKTVSLLLLIAIKQAAARVILLSTLRAITSWLPARTQTAWPFLKGYSYREINADRLNYYSKRAGLFEAGTGGIKR